MEGEMTLNKFTKLITELKLTMSNFLEGCGGDIEPEAQDPAASQCWDQTDLSVTPGFRIYWLHD